MKQCIYLVLGLALMGGAAQASQRPPCRLVWSSEEPDKETSKQFFVHTVDLQRVMKFAGESSRWNKKADLDNKNSNCVLGGRASNYCHCLRYEPQTMFAIRDNNCKGVLEEFDIPPQTCQAMRNYLNCVATKRVTTFRNNERTKHVGDISVCDSILEDQSSELGVSPQ